MGLLQFNLAQDYPVNMVRNRQRMPSRRDSSRGGSSRPSAEAETHPPCHCPHCHCLCHCPRLEGPSSLRHSQFMEASSPGTSFAPYFGSAIFSFDSPLNRPRINAHVSVLFIDEALDEGGSSAPPDFEAPGDTAKATDLPKADKWKGVEVLDPQLERSQKQPKAAKVKEGKVQEEEEYGPCPVVEEEPED